MKPATSYTFDKTLAVLLHGPPGSYKTTSALRMFEHPYIFDADDNLRGPLQYFQNHYPESFKNIQYSRGGVDDDGKEIPPKERWDRMVKILDEVGRAEQFKNIDGVILDSFTTISEMAQDNIMEKYPSKKGEIGMSQPQWGVFFRAMKQLVIGLKSRGKSIVCIFHDRLEKDEITGVVKYRLFVPGQFGDMAASLFSDVWHSEIEDSGGEYKHLIRPRIGTRYDGLKNSFELDKPVPFDEILKRMGRYPTL